MQGTIAKIIADLIEICEPRDQTSRLGWCLLLLVLVVGAGLRLWGLGNIGLHGDEDVMSLAVRGDYGNWISRSCPARCSTRVLFLSSI